MALESVNGRQTFFGALPDKNVYGAEKAGSGSVKELIFEFDYTDLPARDADNEMLAAIPATATIIAADMKVTTGWVGGTSLSAGTAIAAGGGTPDVDSLITAVQGAVANMNVAGDYVQGTATEAAIQAATPFTTRMAVTVTAVGTYTAGAAVLKVQYIAL